MILHRAIAFLLFFLAGCSTVAVPASTPIAQPRVQITPQSIPTTAIVPASPKIPTATPEPILQLSTVLTDFLGLRAPTLAWSDDSQFLAFAGRQRTVRIWSVADQSLADANIYTYISSLNWSNDGIVNAAGYDSTAWRLNPNGTINQGYFGHANAVFAVAPNPTQDLIVSVSSDKRLRWWNAAGDEITVINNGASLWNAVWNPQGTLLATSDGEYHVKLWSANGELQATLNGHSDDSMLLAWNGDGTILASAGLDGSVRLWSASGGALQTWRGSVPIVGLAWHPSNSTLTWLDAEGNMRQEVIEFSSVQSAKTAFTQPLAWNPAGTILAVGRMTSIVELRNLQGTTIQYLEGHTAEVMSVAWSNDGRWLATGSGDGTVRIWRMQK